jgi:oligoribonuclease NrnB/cAMP/cGMP phosphodiesterase (DHH superfamily)
MRIISQDGKIDVPYNHMVFEVKTYDKVNYSSTKSKECYIVAHDMASRDFKLGIYPNISRALDEMRTIRGLVNNWDQDKGQYIYEYQLSEK